MVEPRENWRAVLGDLDSWLAQLLAMANDGDIVGLDLAEVVDQRVRLQGVLVDLEKQMLT